MRPASPDAAGRAAPAPPASRRRALGAAALALLAACAERPAADAPAARTAPPNVLMVSVDTLRRDHLGLYGYERDTTPHLDRLAEECLVFDDAYATVPWTLPSHMTLMTGLFQGQHGVTAADVALDPGVPTLAQRFRAAGYHTVGLYYPGWLDARYGFERGFEVYLPHLNAREAEQHLREALDERPPDRPLFLFVHVFDVHCSDMRREGATMYTPPPPYDELFVQGAAETLAGLNVFKLWNRPRPGREVPAVTPQQAAALVGLYDGNVRYVDQVLHDWIADWRGRGIFDEAVFVLSSDHGEGLGQRGGHWGGHGKMYSEGLRIPLLLRLPGGERGGTRVSARASLADVAPTLMELVGAEDERLPGTSLLGDLPRERPLLLGVGESGVLHGRWKLTHDQDSGETLIYDLERDPAELAPLRESEQPQAFAERRALLERVAAELQGGRFVRAAVSQESLASEDERAALEALGYVEETRSRPDEEAGEQE